MKRLYLLLILPLATFFLSFQLSYAQERTEIPEYIKEKFKNIPLASSSAGTEYLVVLPPNDTTASFDNVVIYVGTLEEEARVTLSLPAQNFTFAENIKIAPYTVASFLSNGGGQNVYAVLQPKWEVRGRGTNEQKGILVQSDVPVSVYVGSFRGYTAEGYMALPISAFGKSYIHCSLRDNREKGDQFHTGFICAAPYDDTRITVALRGPTGLNPNVCMSDGSSSKKIGSSLESPPLMRGEVWNVWNRFDLPGGIAYQQGSCDFTGSLITSNNPIGVFSYHERTAIPLAPYGGAMDANSRDNLVEQLLPINLWGKVHLSVPIYFPPSEFTIAVKNDHGPTSGFRNGGGDFFRVVASEPNTRFNVSWQDQVTGDEMMNMKSILLKEMGDIWEYQINTSDRSQLSINGACSFVSDKPVQVMQYNYTEGVYVSSTSDPFMTLVPPIEQYGNSTVFQTASKMFLRHQYNLIAKGDPTDVAKNRALLETITIKEGSSPATPVMNRGTFKRINNTDYYYMTFELVPSKSYYIQGQTSLCGTLYGLGEFVSYGWPSSMSLIEPGTLDTLSPQVSNKAECSIPNRINRNNGEVLVVSSFADTTNLPAATKLDDKQEDKGITIAPRLLQPSNLQIYKYYNLKPASAPTTSWMTPKGAVKEGKVEMKVLDIYSDATGIMEYRDNGRNKKGEPNYAYDTIVYIADKIAWFEDNEEVQYLDFGNDIITGGVYIADLVIKNIKEKTTRIDSIFLDKAGKGQLSIAAQQFPIILGPQQQCTIKVTFTPTGVTVEDRIIVNTECLYFELPVQGKSGTPVISVNDYSFGQVQVNGYKTIQKAIKIENIGSQTLVVNGWHIVNHPSAQSSEAFPHDEVIFSKPLPWSLEPNQFETATITFRPKVTGPLSATIDFLSNAGNNGTDKKNYGELTGEGIQAGPAITSVDWKERRVLTLNDSTVELTNSGNTPIVIKNFDGDRTNGNWRTAGNDLVSPDGSFRIINYKSYYGNTVYPESGTQEPKKISIAVRFEPQSETSSSTEEKFFVNFETGVPNNTVYSILAGKGILPQIEATGYTFPLTMLAQTATGGSLTIKNISTTAPLLIKSVKFAAGSYQITDFTITPDISTIKDTIIPIGGEIVCDVTFTPQSTSPVQRLAIVNIESDAATGPEVNPTVVTPAELKGTVYNSGGQIRVPNFGTVTRCIDTVANIIVTNESATTPMTIKNITVHPSYSNIFIVDASQYKGTIIQPEDILNIKVRFIGSNYSGEGDITAPVLVETDMMDLVDTIKATILVIPVELSLNSYTKQLPGNILNFPINIKMGADNSFYTYSNAKITNFRIELKINPSVVHVNGVEGSGISFETDYAKGIVTIIGKDISVQKDGALCNIKLMLLQGDENTFDIEFGNVSFVDRDSCVSQTNQGGNIQLAVCGGELRDIVISKNSFAIAPITPSPYIGSELKISFSLGFDVDAKIDIYNSLGEVVKEVLNSTNLPAGMHEVNVNINELGTGTYMINMKSGPFENKQPFVIVK